MALAPGARRSGPGRPPRPAPQLIQLGNRLIRARNLRPGDQRLHGDGAPRSAQPGRLRGHRAGRARAASRRSTRRSNGLGRCWSTARRPSTAPSLQAAREYCERRPARAGDAPRSPRAEEFDATRRAVVRVRGLLWLGAGLPYYAEPLADAAGRRPAVRRRHLALAGPRPHASCRAPRAGGRGDSRRASRRSTRPGSSRRRPSACPRPPPSAPTEIKRSERAPLLAVMAESLIRAGAGRRGARPCSTRPSRRCRRTTPGCASRATAEAGGRGRGSQSVDSIQVSFDDTAWALRVPFWAARPVPMTVPDGAPSIADGQASVTGRRRGQGDDAGGVRHRRQHAVSTHRSPARRGLGAAVGLPDAAGRRMGPCR